MSAQTEPREDSYDIVVIGAGLGGISAAACLSKVGKKVLVVERLDGPGGCARVFQRGPYTFDPAIHWTVQAGEGQILDILLRLLGVRDLCTFLPIDPLYSAVFPDFHIHPSATLEGFIAAHAEHFPHEAEGFGQFMQVAAQVTRESQQLPPQLSLRDLDQAVAQFPTLFKYRTATMAEVMDEFLADHHLKAACSTTWPYPGLPPSRLSFYTWAAMLIAMFDHSLFYCQGSFQKVADAFAAALTQSGGELVFGAEVQRILVADGHVTGVQLADGREIQAPTVVSNADATATFEKMVGEDKLPASFMRRFRRLEPSLSACVLYAATSLDLRQFDAAHETFINRHWDHDQTYADILAGKPGAMWVNVPTLLDATLAPEGEHLIIFTSLALYDPGVSWEEYKEPFTEQLLGELNTLFPGIRDHLTFLESATPPTLERYTLNRQGATYGWSNTPTQAGTQRPGHLTPISGLLLSGHWTQPGSGSLRAMYSGLQTAMIAQGATDFEQFLGALGAA